MRLQFRVAETVAAELRERILSSRIPDGPLPKQESLMAEFGVSAPSIREALRILDAEGLITVRRGKIGGATVHRPDASTASFAIGLALQGQRVTVTDLAQALLVFEPHCVASTAQRDDRFSTIVPLLQTNIDDTVALVDRPTEYTTVARQFHRILVDNSENVTARTMAQALLSVWSIQEETWAVGAAESGVYPPLEDQRASVEAHEAILQLVIAGDGDGAADLHRKHLRATQRLVLANHGDKVIDASSPRAVRGFRNL
jgi:DNA-binding FadR family transcriptional regulator